MISARNQTASAFFERLVQVHLRAAQRRRQSEEDASEDDDREAEGQHPAVDGNILQPRNVAGVEPAKPIESPNRNNQAEPAAHTRKQYTFRQKLADNAPSFGARRCPNRNFFFTSRRSRQQQ